MTPLFDPAAYFDRPNALSLSNATDALAAVAGFWLAAVAFLLAFTRQLVVHGDLEGSLAAAAPVVALLVAVVVLLLWAVDTAILFVMGRLVGGDGAFSATGVVAAWGFAPQILGVLAMLATTPFVDVEGTVPADDPAALADAISVEPPTVLALVAGLLPIATTVWAVYIWVHGLSRAHGLATGRAAIGAVAAAIVTMALWAAI
ncbi:YIP1 family protein [Halopiger goleimassiliensis]|uniref:YIP1 family protein n=1 Tax=Halopiger goleimassiliensis TaxID=1293048 RepID=UPI00067773CA|nr:YIP1 family protein [Halopiger goleimassiliensis]